MLSWHIHNFVVVWYHDGITMENCSWNGPVLTSAARHRKHDDPSKYTTAAAIIRCSKTRDPSQYPKRRLSVRSRKVSKPRDLYLELSDRSEIYQSRGFETSRDLTIRRLFGYWDGAQTLQKSAIFSACTTAWKSQPTVNFPVWDVTFYMVVALVYMTQRVYSTCYKSHNRVYEWLCTVT